jgi:hypothetical protein
MANSFYNIGKAEILKGNIDWENDTIHAQLVDTNYTFSASHDTMESSNVPTADRVGDSVALSNKSVSSAGACDADDTTITNVASSETVGGIIIYKYSTGSSSSDIPICFIDTGTGFDLSTDGNNVVLTWSGSGIIS